MCAFWFWLIDFFKNVRWRTWIFITVEDSKSQNFTSSSHVEEPCHTKTPQKKEESTGQSITLRVLLDVALHVCIWNVLRLQSIYPGHSSTVKQDTLTKGQSPFWPSRVVLHLCDGDRNYELCRAAAACLMTSCMPLFHSDCSLPGTDSPWQPLHRVLLSF